MLIKDNKVRKLGTFKDIVSVGFNIKDILDSFNKGMQSKSKKGVANKNLKRMLTRQ